MLMLSILNGGIPPRTYNYKSPKRGARRLATWEPVRRLHRSWEECKKVINNQNIILLNNFNKIHKSGMRYGGRGGALRSSVLVSCFSAWTCFSEYRSREVLLSSSKMFCRSPSGQMLLSESGWYGSDSHNNMICMCWFIVMAVRFFATSDRTVNPHYKQ